MKSGKSVSFNKYSFSYTAETIIIYEKDIVKAFCLFVKKRLARENGEIQILSVSEDSTDFQGQRLVINYIIFDQKGKQEYAGEAILVVSGNKKYFNLQESENTSYVSVMTL